MMSAERRLLEVLAERGRKKKRRHEFASREGKKIVVVVVFRSYMGRHQLGLVSSHLLHSHSPHLLGQSQSAEHLRPSVLLTNRFRQSDWSQWISQCLLVLYRCGEISKHTHTKKKKERRKRKKKRRKKNVKIPLSRQRREGEEGEKVPEIQPDGLSNIFEQDSTGIEVFQSLDGAHIL